MKASDANCGDGGALRPSLADDCRCASSGVGKIKFLIVCPAAKEFRVGTVGGRAAWRMRVFRFSMLTPLSVAAAAPDSVEPRIVDESVEPIDFDAEADLVGISFMTFNAPRAYEIAWEFKRRGKTVVLGGYHPTLLPEEAARHGDAVCVGEAEPNVPRIVADFQAGRLQRFYSSRDSSFTSPCPDRRLIRERQYVTSTVVQATRGCHNQCEFCSVTAFCRHTFKTRPVREVVDEIRSFRNKSILFMDDNLVADPGYAASLFRELIPLRKHWYAQIGVSATRDPEFLELMRASGCRGVFTGFESLSQDSLNGTGKQFNRADEYREAIRRLHAHGIGVCGAFVLGFDQDTPAVFETTARFLEEAELDTLQLTVLTPFPGTQLFERLNQAGRIFDTAWEHYDLGHVVFQPAVVSPEQLTAGHHRILRQFYSWRSILRRSLRQTRYLAPKEIALSFLVSIGYRFKLRATGILESPTRAEPIDAGRSAR